MPMTATSANALSTDEFLDAVHAGVLKTAVVDFDGTLWPGDAGSGFMNWSIQTGLLSPAAAEHLLHRHACYRRGEVDEISICGEMTQIYRGLEESSVRASAAEYFRQHVRPHFFPVMVKLVHDLQAKEVEVWAVSSTNNWMIEEGVREMNIQPHRVLAAAVVVEQGRITDTLVHVPSDEGKAEALRRVGLDRPDAVFGNSVHDLAMLKMAAKPFPVNPSEELARQASELGWPVYYPVSTETAE
ncbi:MAG: HAD family hydrolase [Janthinobacterium lividum]